MVVETRTFPIEKSPVTESSDEENSNPQSQLKIALTNNGHYCGFYASKTEALEHAEKCGMYFDALCKKKEYRMGPEIDTGHDCDVISIDPKKIKEKYTATMPFYLHDGDIRKIILHDEVKIIIP